MNTDPIKKRIQELCPDIVKNEHAQLITWDNRIEYFVELVPITLAVVLRAIEASGFIRGTIGEKKEIKLRQGETVAQARNRANFEGEWIAEVNLSDPCKRIILGWNLKKDDWESQTRETQLFIGSLLQV